MRIVLLIAMLSFAAASALAQPQGKRGGGGDGFKGPGQFLPQERGRDAGREQMRERDRHERMRPEERDKLRQDIEEANRRMERRGRQ